MEALLDPTRAEMRVEFGMAEAEVAQRTQWRASAAVFRAIDALLREAAAHPEVFIPRSSPDAVEFAERAAVADLAVRLNLAESTVRSHAHVGHTLRTRLPQLWAWFGEGEISTQNAREAATVVAELPQQVWQAFDEAILAAARSLAPARFKQRALSLREKLHSVPLVERHQSALQGRGVWSESERDGMGWLHAHLGADRLALVMARIDGRSLDLLSQPDEQRTMAQVRADVAADLLIGEIGKDVIVTVALTIPALSLLGREASLLGSEAGAAGSAVLDGAGPIDIETARELCALAPSFTRVLTDPISSVILDLDRRQYRPTTALKRWLALRDVTCTFPGCGRSAKSCDIDHTTAWADGGLTSTENLAHLCRKHHTMKHESRWKVEKHSGSPSVWTSPTGYVRSTDPPPF